MIYSFAINMFVHFVSKVDFLLLLTNLIAIISFKDHCNEPQLFESLSIQLS